MQGCLGLGALAIMGWICWEIFVEFLGEIGWFWGAFIIIIGACLFIVKK